MTFTTIDFETANQFPQSACSVGLAKFDSTGTLVDRFYSLLRPPRGYDFFNARNIEIHGIRPRNVLDAPDWSYIWPEILYFIGDDFLVAHNARFDIGVMTSLLTFYHLEFPDLSYLDTLQISRKVWPHLPSHALTALSAHFDLQYNAHNALDDAINCGKILAKACNGRLSTSSDLLKFLISKGIHPQHIPTNL